MDRGRRGNSYNTGRVVAESEFACSISIFVLCVSDDATENGGFGINVLENDAVVPLGHGASLPCLASSDDGIFLEVGLCGILPLATARKVEVGPLHVSLAWTVAVRI